MICNKCGKQTREGRTCEHCGNVLVPTSNSGLATLRVIARKHLPAWMMIVQPVNCFIGYKVFISVDDQEYVLKSKKQQIDILVVPGVHNVRIASSSRKSAKLMKGVGMATRFVGAVWGSSSTYVVGNIMEDTAAAMSQDGVNIQFEAGEFMEIKVKPNFMGKIVEDK